MFTPPAKVARTERTTTTTTTVVTVNQSVPAYTAAHFNARRTGTSTKRYGGTRGANVTCASPIGGVGKELAWIYAPGSKGISVFTVTGSAKISANEIGGPVPVFKSSQGEIAFVAECSAKGSSNQKTLAFCTSLGAVLSCDRGIAINFEFESSGSSTSAPVMRPFDIRSFAVLSPDAQIAAPMFHQKIAPSEHVVAGTEDGYVLCAFRRHDHADSWNVLFCNVALADAECAPSIAADLDISGAGAYLRDRHSAKLPRNQTKGSDSQSSASSQATASWWKSWIPSGLRGGGGAANTPTSPNVETYDGLNDDTRREQLYANEDEESANLGNTGSSKVLAKLPNRRIEHVQAAKNGICFTVGSVAVALATKVTASPIRADDRSGDTDGDLAQNGLRLVWSCPICSILSPSRSATVAALTASDATIYALVLYDDQPASGILASISAHNGTVLSTRHVSLPEAFGESNASPSTRIELLASVAGSGTKNQSVAVVVGNSIAHLSLIVTAHNPCHSTDVESLNEEVLASGVVDGRLYVLTNDGPFPSDEAGEIDTARSRQQVAALLDDIRHEGGRLTADEAVLGASDEILYSAESHADNWARQFASTNSNAKEDLNALTFVTSQLHRRQLKHRSFVTSILGRSDLAAKLSHATIARLISDQEKLLALRFLRDLQNAEPQDGLHELTQSMLHKGVTAVASHNRSTTRLQGHRTSNAEVFYADHNSVVDLIHWTIAELGITIQSANMTAAAKVDASIALGNLAPRVLEAVYESRNTLTVPGSLMPAMWTSMSHNNSDGNHGIFDLCKALSEGLSDALDISVRFNVGLSLSHNVSGGSIGPVSTEAQLSLLHLAEGLINHTLILHSTNNSAGSEPTSPTSAGQSLVGTATVDFTKLITTSTFAEDLLTRTLLRPPFLVPAHVSPSTGDIHMFGYPYGAPKLNPAATKISSAVLHSAESFAVKFKVYRVLYAFALSDPNVIGSFIQTIDCPDVDGQTIAAAATQHFAKYQEYCATIPTFFAASLHMFLLDSRFQREQEVCFSSKFCGLDQSCHASDIRCLFMKHFAPQLLWFEVPLFVDPFSTNDATNVVGAEASLALLKEGTMHSTNIPSGESALDHRMSCAALSRLCWLSFNKEEGGDTVIAGEGNDVEAIERDDANEAGAGGVLSVAAQKVRNEVPNRIDLDITVVGFQAKFLQATHSNSILAAPELVQHLLALPDNVDAWCAAAAVCDAIRSAHGGLHESESNGAQPSTTSPASPSSSSSCGNGTVVQLLQQVYGVAMQHDGSDLLIKLQEAATSETALARTISQTAQGRITLASRALSGLPLPEVGASSNSASAHLPLLNATPTSSALIGHRSAKPAAHEKHHVELILGPVLGSSTTGQQVIKILGDWIDLHASKGGVLAAPSPALTLLPFAEAEPADMGVYPKSVASAAR